MRIIEIISETGVNGASQHGLLLCRALARRGHAVTVVCRPGGWIRRELAAVPVEVVESDLHRWPIDELWRIVMGSEAFGPFERMDRVGLDVVLDIERHYAAESGLTRDDPPAFLREMVDRGELGVKSRKGFYTYDEEGRPVNEGRNT